MKELTEAYIVGIFILGIIVYCSYYLIRIFQMTHANTACAHYKWEYTENNRGCAGCPGRAVCRLITPITKRAVKASMGELPQYLAHIDNVVRKAARIRMGELTNE